VTSSAELLQQGIAAAKAGRNETARRLLTQVVEQGVNNVTAWLWLSGVVDSLDDKQVCLENVLELDPGNQAARKGLDWVLEQKEASVYTPPLISESQAQRTVMPLTPAAAILYGKPKEPEPKPEPEPPAETALRPHEDRSAELSEAELAAMREFDDEYLCPYCAAPTQPEDKRCAACKGVLWMRQRRRAEGSYWFWILMGSMILSITQSAYLFIVALTYLFGRLAMGGQIKTAEEFVGVYLGLNTLPPDVTATILKLMPPLVFWLFVAGMMVQVVQMVLIYMRWRPLYWYLVGTALLVAFFALARLALNPSPGGVISLVIAMLPVWFLLRIEEDFMLDRTRIVCRSDPGLRSHSEFYMRGRDYARKNMWALAAVHYKRAIGAAPSILTYHLALATAFIGLKRYERAGSALREAQRLEPNDRKVQELAGLIAAGKASTNTA